MRRLRGTDAGLVTGKRDAVHAGVAVHPDVAGERLAIALLDEGGQLVAVADHVGHADVDIGVGRGVLRCLGDDPGGQDAGEEEVRRDDNAAGAEQLRAPQRGGDRRRRERDERQLHAVVPASLPQQPGHLRDLGVGVRVAGTAADEHHCRPLARRTVQCGVDPFLEQRQQERVRAERTAVRVGEAGMAYLLAGHRTGDVALAVSGRDEDERHGDQVPVPARDELADGLGERRRRQLDEPAGHVDLRCGLPFAEPLHERSELPDAGLDPGAVADDDERRRRVRRVRWVRRNAHGASSA